MSTQIQRRRGTTAEHSTFTGVEGELTVDTTKDTVVVHDGATTGGRPLLREDQANLPTSVTNGISVPSANNVAISTNGTGRLFVDANGDVGFGTSSPSNYRLNLVARSGYEDVAIFSSTGTNINSRINLAPTGTGLGVVNATTNALTFQVGAAERLRITSDGKLGLGTSSPSSKFYVLGDASNYGITTEAPSGYGSLTFKQTSGNSISVGMLSNNLFVYDNAAGYTRLTLDSSGRLGIGTTSPTKALEVAAGSTISGGLLVTGSSSPQIRLEEATGVTGSLGADSTAIYVGTVSNHPLILRANVDERARIDTSGRLLVGTSSARTNFYNTTYSSLLQVEADVSTTALASLTSSNNGTLGGLLILGHQRSGSVGGNTVLQSGDELGVLAFMGSDGSEQVEGAHIKAAVDGTPGANDLPSRLVFSTTADGASSPTERMRIGANGNIFVNTSSNPLFGVNKIGIVSILSDEDRDVVNIKHEKDGNNSINIWQTGTNTFNALHFFKGNSQTGVGTISVSTTGTSYTTVSDYRIKENVTPLTGAIDRLKDLQVHRFNLIAEPSKTVDGFIAHEAQAVVPECVTGMKDAVDDNDNPIYQGIDQSKLVPLLTAALQEAIAKIETLEAKVAALQSA